jgi:hypothetical protein
LFLFRKMLKIPLNPPKKGGRRLIIIFSPLYKGGWGGSKT